jgi:hypothetical protein
MSEEIFPQKTVLLGLYQRAMLEYVNSLTELQERMGRIPKAEYDRLYERLEFLEASADKAKFYLDSHAHEHGC